MKSVHALAVALALGVAGALLNFVYLSKASRGTDEEQFLGLKENRNLGPGDRLEKEDIETVPIPKLKAGVLRRYAFVESDLSKVVGEPVWLEIEGGSLLLRDYLKTPPPEFELAEEERAMFVPVDASQFVPTLVEPGRFVDFIYTRPPLPTRAERRTFPDDGLGGELTPESDPALASEPALTPPASPDSPEETERIGPFEILALGNRLARSEVHRAVRQRQVQENILTVRVKAPGGRLEDKAMALHRLRMRTQGRGVSILLYPKDWKPPKAQAAAS
jgi:hypothetical protein